MVKETRIPGRMQNDGIKLESKIDSTNAFATHFKSVFVKPSETNFSLPEFKYIN